MKGYGMGRQVSINCDDVFSTAAAAINIAYDRADRDPKLPKNERQYVTDDERTIFDGYMNLAVAELTSLIASSLTSYSISGGKINLIMNVNPEISIPSLDTMNYHIRQYIIARCKEQWYNAPKAESEDEGSKIKHALQLRTRPVSEHRKCRPLW